MAKDPIKQKQGRNNKKRSYAHETQVTAWLNSLGGSAKRAWGSNGRALGVHHEVDIYDEEHGFRIGCRSTKKLSKRFIPPVTIDMQALKLFGGQEYFLLHKEFLELLLRTYFAVFIKFDHPKEKNDLPIS